MPVNKEFKSLIELIKANHELNQKTISERLGINDSYLSDMINGRVSVTKNITKKIYELFQIKLEDQEVRQGGRNLVPFYDDVVSIGGTNNMVAESKAVYGPSEYIDTGDWFKDATAALRHYGESMTEYPSGCILALREIKDRNLIIWGKDYVIETDEYRITKRMQRGRQPDHIRAYSTDLTTYPDGQLVHEPIDIPVTEIRRLFLVLGYIVKKNGGLIQ